MGRSGREQRMCVCLFYRVFMLLKLQFARRLIFWPLLYNFCCDGEIAINC